jgi:ubiquitin-protein ligase
MSFDIRETRLRNDYKRVKELEDRSDLIQIAATEAEPPERYLIRFTCKGVERLNAYGQPVYRENHEVRVYLHAEYPLKQPQLKWVTPIFHPNIHVTGAVCIGAWWPAKTLDELLLSLGEMIQYKNLDPSDPMNSKAAAWASRNRHLFPIDDRPLKGESLTGRIVIGMDEMEEDEDSDEFGIRIL